MPGRPLLGSAWKPARNSAVWLTKSTLCWPSRRPLLKCRCRAVPRTAEGGGGTLAGSGGDERLQGVKVALGGVQLDSSGQGTPDAGQGVVGPGEGRDDERHNALRVPVDGEGFLALFGMGREGPVRKPERVGLIDEVDDAAGGDRRDERQSERLDHGGALSELGDVRPERHASPPVCFPPPHPVGGALEHAATLTE